MPTVSSACANQRRGKDRGCERRVLLVALAVALNGGKGTNIFTRIISRDKTQGNQLGTGDKVINLSSPQPQPALL
jgi:hypothetical protein